MKIFIPLSNRQDKDRAESKADVVPSLWELLSLTGEEAGGRDHKGRSSLQEDTVGYLMAGEISSRQRYTGSCKTKSQGSDPVCVDMEGSPEEVMLNQKDKT